MTAKKTGQDSNSTAGKAADVALGDGNQTAAAAAAAAPPQTGPAATEEQPSGPVVPAVPITPSPSAPATDSAEAAAGTGEVKGAPELPGYLVTEVSSVLHDGTWYHQGDEIFLNDKEANPLLHRRIIEPSWSKK